MANEIEVILLSSDESSDKSDAPLSADSGDGVPPPVTRGNGINICWCLCWYYRVIMSLSYAGAYAGV